MTATGDAIAADRASLAELFGSAGIHVAPSPGQVAPPCVLLGGPSGDWVELSQYERGAVRVSWRVLAVAGSWDSPESMAELVELVGAILELLRPEARQVGNVGPLGNLVLGSRIYLAAAVPVTTEVAMT